MAAMSGMALGLGLASLGTSAATQIYGAKKAAGASRAAAGMQERAAGEAQKRYDYAQGVTDDVYAPYLASGRKAASTLGRLVTPATGARFAAPDPTQPPPRQPMSVNRAVPRGGGGARTLGGMVPPAPGGGGGFVLMEAPDGSGVRPVPADQVQRFEQAGARRVQ